MKGIYDFSKLISILKGSKLRKLDSEGNNIEVEFTLNPPARIDDISSVERDLMIKLPHTYKEFLLKYNGARIFDYEGLDGFIILGTEDIVKANKYVASTFDEDWIDTIIIFAKYIGEGNYLGFGNFSGENEYYVIDCFQEELPENWGKIAENFDEFLRMIVESQGRKYWLIKPSC